MCSTISHTETIPTWDEIIITEFYVLWSDETFIRATQLCQLINLLIGRNLIGKYKTIDQFNTLPFDIFGDI